MFYPTFVHINQTKNNNNMENILIYISQCAIWLGILYLPFRWMLRKETYFRANRYTLLAITIVAFLLPWINIHWVAFQLGYEETSVITALPQDFISSNDTNASTFNRWKTISTIYRKQTGKTHIYYPLMTKEEYTRRVMNEVKDNFFGGSGSSLLKFFVREEKLTEEEIEELIQMVKLANE